MTCPKHPTYQAKRQPSGECSICWRIWYTKGEKPKDYIQDRDLGDEKEQRIGDEVV